MKEDTVVSRVGKFNVEFGSQTLSSRAGMVLIKDFIDRLGVAQILDRELEVKQRERGYSESQSVLGLVYNQIAGGSCLSDLEVLRGDPGTLHLLGVDAILAAQTAGEFLRKFDMGDLRDLQRVTRLLQERARPYQHGDVCTIDADSSIYEQASATKQGSDTAYNGEVGYHPLFAFWDEEGELLFSHLRRGSAYTSRNVIWFLAETVRRVPSGATKKFRADSGFYDKKVVAFCEEHQMRFAITADQTKPLVALIAAIEESAWQDLERYGTAQVAEVRYQPVGWRTSYRYVVKRDLVLNKKLEAEFRYHVLVTDDEQRTAEEVLVWHLAHASMENRIKEHKSGFALEKLPTRGFHANWAYLLIGQIAFNLVAWFKRLVLPEAYHQATIKTIRHHVLNVAAKIVRTGRRLFLKISEHYRYQEVWQFAMKQLATLTI